MREVLGSERMAQVVGDLTVVIAATLWSVLVFSIVAALVIALLNALSGARTSIRSAVGRVAAVAFVVAACVHANTELLHHPKNVADTVLSMAEFATLLISPVLLVGWGVAFAGRRVLESRRGARPTAIGRRGR